VEHIKYIQDYIDQSISVKLELSKSKDVLGTISQVASLLIGCFDSGNKVLLAGNGGSAADAQHIAAEFVSRFFFDRPGLPALALTTDTSMVTAIGNDYGFDQLFSRQLQAQSRVGDVFIGISTSGNSVNVINAVNEAKKQGVTSVVLCGLGGELKNIADISICVPSTSTPFVQECHICIGHMICAIVEKEIFDGRGADV
jgi:D-sedoheptulose 7-phosphate isomerase